MYSSGSPNTDHSRQSSERQAGVLPSLLLSFTLALITATGARAQACIGDCDGDGTVTVDEVVRGINITLGEATESCPAFDADTDGVVTIDELVAGVNNVLTGCPQDSEAFIVATDFQTGSFGTISLDPPREVVPSSSSRRINADATVRTFGGLVYVINRFLADNIQVLDPAGDFTTLWQCSTGVGTNPQDIAFVDETKAYVTLYDATDLLVIDPSVGADCEGFIVDRIDLSPFADDDGLPEMDKMALVDGFLYVSLQRLDRDAFFSPAAQGMLLVIDTTTDAPVDGILLSGENPFGATKGLTVNGSALLVSQIGNFGVQDGGIERVDLTTGTAEGFFITEAALGGDIYDFVLVSSRLGYAVIGRPDFTNDLVSFDPKAGTAIATVLSGVEYIPDIELNDRGELYVADRTGASSGMRVFRAQDGVELTEGPIHLGLPPFEFVFLK